MGFAVNYLRNLAALAVGREPARPLLFSYYVTHRCSLMALSLLQRHPAAALAELRVWGGLS